MLGFFVSVFHDRSRYISMSVIMFIDTLWSSQESRMPLRNFSPICLRSFALLPCVCTSEMLTRLLLISSVITGMTCFPNHSSSKARTRS
jgi:hypothetical protein